MGIRNLLGATDPFTNFLTAVQKPLNSVIIGLLVVIALAAVAFAIWVGFRLAKAEDEGKRKEAKNQLIWSIVAVVAVVALAVLFGTVFAGNGIFSPTDMSNKLKNDEVGQAVGKVIVAINGVLNILLQLGSTIGLVFAVYVGARLAMAEDEGKRKQAKAQLLWTVVAVVGAIALSMIISSVMGILIGMV